MKATYLIRRIVMMILALFGMSVVVFILIRMIPGDPMMVMLGDDYNPEMAEQFREAYGLNKPLVVQYLMWIGNVLKGNLGTSIISKQSVATLVLRRSITTFMLALGTSFVAVLVAIPLGVVSATHKNSWIDNACRVFSMVGAATPTFVFGLLIMIFFSLVVRLLPPGGSVYDYGPKALIMPCLALGISNAAIVSRTARSEVLDVLGQDYVRTARAKGVREKRVLYTHALRNAMIPVITVVGLQFGAHLGGAVVIDNVFSLNGLGSLIVESIYYRDYTVLQGGLLFVGAFMTIVNFVVDMVYTIIDPRIRYQ